MKLRAALCPLRTENPALIQSFENIIALVSPQAQIFIAFGQLYLPAWQFYNTLVFCKLCFVYHSTFPSPCTPPTFLVHAISPCFDNKVQRLQVDCLALSAVGPRLLASGASLTQNGGPPPRLPCDPLRGFVSGLAPRRWAIRSSARSAQR